MAVTPTTDTNNILNIADTSANKSKYMTKSLDGSGFGDVLDKVSKNYSDTDATVKVKQNETSQDLATSARNIKTPDTTWASCWRTGLQPTTTSASTKRKKNLTYTTYLIET